MSAITEMIFIEQLNSAPKEVLDMLIYGEEVIASFKSIRDYGAFTNKRIIYIDKQGVLGKKVEIYSIPLKSIVMFSSENAGLIDFTTEFQVWTKVGVIKMSFKRNCDIHMISKYMASHIL